MVVLSRLDCIFVFKEKQRMALKAFLCGQHVFSAFLPTRFGKLNTMAYRGSPWGGHMRLMLTIVPIDASSCSYVDRLAVKSLIAMVHL